MRIHSIQLENITSLRGQHHIDFDQILGTEDIFAITGPTGSGKSSILSAIGLALYNTANKDGLGPIELVSQGAEYGRVILHFSTGGKNYSSTWECRLTKKNGELLTNPKLNHVFYLEGTAIGETGEQILGLSYAQFSKTVILNQGQFSQFLMSKYTERRNLLEKLFDSEQLTKIGSILNEKLRLQRNKLQSTENALQAISPQTQESPEDLQASLETYKNKQNFLKQIEDRIKIFAKRVEDYRKVRQSISEQQQKKQKLENETASLIEKRNALATEKEAREKEYKDSFTQLESLRPLLLKAIEKQQQRSILSKNIDELRHNYQQQETEIKKQQAVVITQKEKNEQKRLELEEHIKHYPKLSSTDEHEAISTYVKRIKQTTDLYHTLNDALIRFDKDIELLNKNHEKYTVELKEQEQELNLLYDYYQANPEKNELLSIIEKELVELGDKINRTTKAEQLLKQLILLQEQKGTSLKQKEGQIKESELELKHQRELFEKIETRLQLVIERERVRELETAVLRCTEESQKNGECVVCHSPWSELPLFSTPQRKITEASENRDALSQEKDQVNLAILSLSSKLDTFKEQKKQFEDDLTQLNREIEATKADFEASKTEELLARQKKRLEDKTAYPLYFKRHNELCQKMIESEKEKIELFGQIEKTKTKSIELNRDREDQIQSVLKISPHYPSELEKLMEIFDEEIKQIERRKTIQHALDNGKELERQLQHQLDGQQLQLQQIEQKGKELKKQKEILEQEIKESFDYDNPADQLQKLTTNVQLKQQRYSTLNDQWLTLNQEIQTKQQFLTGLDEVAKAKEIERLQLESTGLDCPDNLEDHEDYNQEVLHTFLSKRDGLFIQDHLEALESLKLLVDTGINPLLHSLQEKIRHYSEQYHHLLGQQKIIAQGLERLKKLTEQFSQEKRELERLLLLNELIGKQEFRDFALSIIERELIKTANIELKHICDGRYQLKQQTSGKHKYEFFVIDYFSGALERKVSSLSGGETFLVSLAMAMALSEMTRGKTEIDSFFIDEGFGSLDDESLNDALDTLLQIRNRGKRIGIISHVQGLTERIPINIRLSKSELGESTLSFIQQSL